MKRTCNGCKALDWDRGCWECRLRHKIDIEKGKPLEECPKPMTNEQYIRAKEAK
jgi:hypothetical protein